MVGAVSLLQHKICESKKFCLAFTGVFFVNLFSNLFQSSMSHKFDHLPAIAAFFVKFETLDFDGKNSAPLGKKMNRVVISRILTRFDPKKNVEFWD